MAHSNENWRHTFPGAGQYRTHFSTQVERHMVGRGLLAGGVLVALMLTGCGGTTEVIQPQVNVSVGQQLIDLKKARDAGALTESEFQRQKEQLIDSIR
jgi:hypothetical protein